MFGKSTRNNKFAIVTKQVPHYGLRKFNFGVTSVLLGTTIFMGGAMTTQVNAETVTPDQQPKIEVVSKDDNSAVNTLDKAQAAKGTNDVDVNQTPASQSEQPQAEDAKADPTETSEAAASQTPTEQNEQAKAEKPENEESKDLKSDSNELDKKQATAEQKKQDEKVATDTKAEEEKAASDKSKKSSQANGQENSTHHFEKLNNFKNLTFKVVKDPRDVVYNGYTFHIDGKMYTDVGNEVTDTDFLNDLNMPTKDLSNEELKKLGLKSNEFFLSDSEGAKVLVTKMTMVFQNEYGQLIISNAPLVHNPDGSLSYIGPEAFGNLVIKYDCEASYYADTVVDIDPAHPEYGFTTDDLNKTVTRTINVHNPDGKIATETQKVDFSRVGLISTSNNLVYDDEGRVIGVDQVDTKLGYDNNGDGIAEYTMAQGDQAWQTSKNSFDEFTTPAIEGYAPSIAVVKSETVTPETADSVIDITYTKLKHDTGDPTVDPENPSVKPEQPVTPPEDKPEQPETPSVKPEVPSVPDTNETIPTDTSTDEPEQTVAGPVKAENPAAVSTKKAPTEKQAPSENVAPKPIAGVQPNKKAQATTVKTAVVKAQSNQQASEELPQTGSDHEVASLLSVLGITLLSGLGLIWFSRKKEN
ncbi:YSIRK-type signal peptide-containing protein [uncultured Lactobacillus sp.]|uniref:mucin-binding protein n=1 Tax=uncultured Lactobacillus sp. TaxID=153152 RepID=UPI0028039D62|nr:YSIRK-type signal peptide-containing protein [uncultured Lactobacillus sp.]